MKKQVIALSSAMIVALASFSTAFAMDAYKINNDGSTVINYAYNDAQREGMQSRASKDGKLKDSYRETRTKKDPSAPTGKLYSGYGWTNVVNSKGKEIVHTTTTRLEFRSGSGQGEVYAEASESGVGKIAAQTDYIETPSTAYVYYKF
ncbi:hypothetical protein [Aminipila luticellarii]|uniref:Uncharacterized protein n=1 Tax=Aminipila luticellarii TaxID=2507160 RepID=A0A410PWM6_9FIRM|nr:hypothetical protein [Aminipila luticellarii]QAT43341.1 hypothetical protein EQM06_08995 [Aminipila luticellarii]